MSRMKTRPLVFTDTGKPANLITIGLRRYDVDLTPNADAAGDGAESVGHIGILRYDGPGDQYVGG